MEGEFTMKVAYVKLVDRLEAEIYYKRLPKEGDAVLAGPCYWLMGMAIMNWIGIEGVPSCYWRRTALLRREDLPYLDDMKLHTNEMRKALWHNEFPLAPISERFVHTDYAGIIHLGTIWFVPYRQGDKEFGVDLYAKSGLSDAPRIGNLWLMRYRMLKLWRTGERLKPILDFIHQYRP